ncbi:MAG: YifB family Mg chelatase-like AAA ATPase [Actinomycetaceae bacterium]|nr:YifB family Mg chelatase-like AAA ATPase [Actinomycetaceae bacterium]MDY6082977.1 YifB family Mg chelatase-like AAA ATPase [Actinomycetaceae bacterium]
MSVGKAQALAVIGVSAAVVGVEAVMLSGLPHFTIVGLPDTAVNESRERIRAAFSSSGISFPQVRLTVNLSPANIPKSGTGFDLAIAMAILAAMGGRVSTRDAYVGELGLDGSIRPVHGILPAALGFCAQTTGSCDPADGQVSIAQPDQSNRIPEYDPRLFVPFGCGEQAALAGANTVEAWHLTQLAKLVGVTCGPIPAQPALEPAKITPEPPFPDLGEVRGHDEAKMALEVAAAGGHHMLMTGAPGIGKTMLAQCLPGILPQLTHNEAIEVAAIRSVTGDFDGNLNTRAPFVAPHHTASASSLIGGGPVPNPGAATLAHHGVLFLDEIPEFSRPALQALRQPMEEGRVRIDRVKASVTFPAQFQLVGAANPCLCGNYIDEPRRCRCSASQRRMYFQRIGGPLLDRFDIKIVLRRLTASDMHSSSARGSADVRSRVCEARERQHRRLADTTMATNAALDAAWLQRNTRLAASAQNMIEQALVHGRISMRGCAKILRLAWTLADLAHHDMPETDDIAFAFSIHAQGGFYADE